MGVPEALVSRPGGSLSGEFSVPGDKSITHRALMLGAVADGITGIAGALQGADCVATRRCLEAMGVTVEDRDGLLRVHGRGPTGLRVPAGPLDLGNSGTGMRLLTGLLAAQAFDCELIGDASLMRRPMERVAKPLRDMGARIATREGCPPLRLQGGSSLRGIEYAMPMASAQVKSAVLLAGLYAEGTTRVIEPGVTRDHTERMLRAMGCRVDVEGSVVQLAGPARLQAVDVDVPADFSSAAFFIVAACICPGSDVLLLGVGVNPTRTGLLNALRAMGADIELTNERTAGDEPVADIHVRGGPLAGIDMPPEWVPLGIDELPVLFIAAAVASGKTTITGAAELRVKESDRLGAMARGLEALGVDVALLPDGLTIRGGTIQGGSVDSDGDHRIAMAFAVAGQIAAGPVHISDTGNVVTSFPGFVEIARTGGLRVEAA